MTTSVKCPHAKCLQSVQIILKYRNSYKNVLLEQKQQKNLQQSVTKTEQKIRKTATTIMKKRNIN